MFASKGAQPDEGDVGAGQRRGMAAVVARPNVQHPQRVPLGGLPAVWCSGARPRSLSTNTQVIWKMCSFVCPLPTLLSTNASCQPEKPENSQVKTWGSASTQGLSAHPRMTSLPTGENPATRENLRNVGDTGKVGGGRCCQQDRRMELGQEWCGSALWIRTVVDAMGLEHSAEFQNLVVLEANRRWNQAL